MDRRSRTVGERKDFARDLLSEPRARRTLATAFAQVYVSSPRIDPTWRDVADALMVAAKAPGMAKQIASAGARQHVLRWVRACDVRTSGELNRARKRDYDVRTVGASDRAQRPTKLAVSAEELLAREPRSRKPRASKGA